LSKCEEIGLKIERLEENKTLQDSVLTVHHAYKHTSSRSPAIKIIENHLGIATAHVSAAQQIPRAIQTQALQQDPASPSLPATKAPAAPGSSNV